MLQGFGRHLARWAGHSRTAPPLLLGAPRGDETSRAASPPRTAPKGKRRLCPLGELIPPTRHSRTARLQKAKTPTRTLGTPHRAAVSLQPGSAAPHAVGSRFRTAAEGRGARGGALPARSGSVRRRHREAPDPAEPLALPHRPP